MKFKSKPKCGYYYILKCDSFKVIKYRIYKKRFGFFSFRIFPSGIGYSPTWEFIRRNESESPDAFVGRARYIATQELDDIVLGDLSILKEKQEMKDALKREHNIMFEQLKKL